MWIRERTTELGAERAEYWGWTNIYTYSKSLAEQIIAQQDDIVKMLVRPSIVESSQSVSVSGMERGLYDDRAADPDRTSRSADHSRQRKAGPRHYSGRYGRGRDPRARR